jgi:hypothetical protein
MAAVCGAGFPWGTDALFINPLIARFGLTAKHMSRWRFIIGASLLVQAIAGQGRVREGGIAR